MLDVLRRPSWQGLIGDHDDGRLYVLGDDATGRALEIVVVVDGGELIVLHAMDLRKKYRDRYDEGQS